MNRAFMMFGVVLLVIGLIFLGLGMFGQTASESNFNEAVKEYNEEAWSDNPDLGKMEDLDNE